MTHSVLQKKCETALGLELDTAEQNVRTFKQQVEDGQELADFWAAAKAKVVAQLLCEHPKFEHDRNFHTCVDCGASFHR